MIPTLDELARILIDKQKQAFDEFNPTPGRQIYTSVPHPKDQFFQAGLAAVRDAVLEGLIAMADSEECQDGPWNYFNSWYFEPDSLGPDDHENPVADWLRSLKGSPE